MSVVVEIQTEVTTDEYFGGCPECGKTDGYLNTGRTHVFMCETHRTYWVAGSNLFSDWRDETEAEQRAKWDEVGMEEFRLVKPIYPVPTDEERLRMKEHEARMAEADRIDRGYGIAFGTDGSMRALGPGDPLFDIDEEIRSCRPLRQPCGGSAVVGGDPEPPH